MHRDGLVLLSALGAVAVLLAFFVALFFRLASRLHAKDSDPQWLEDFSVESYAPMERLLDAGDFRFLEAQPGYRPEIGKRLLAERREIFSEYLSLLIGDFNQLHYFARLMLVHSAQDQPDFARQLFRQQILFYWAVCVIRCKVALYPMGWTALDVPKLLHVLERMRGQLAASATQTAGTTA